MTYSSQVYLGLFNAAYEMANTVAKPDPRSSESSSSSPLSSWPLRVSRIILPTVPRNDLAWSHGLLRLIVTYLESVQRNHYRLVCENMPHVHDYDSLENCVSANHSFIEIYLKEDVARLFNMLNRTANNPSSSVGDRDDFERMDKKLVQPMICFEEMVVLGATELRGERSVEDNHFIHHCSLPLNIIQYCVFSRF